MVSLTQRVEVVQVLPLAAWISHHYLCAWGELSSPGGYFTRVRGRRGTHPSGAFCACNGAVGARRVAGGTAHGHISHGAGNVVDTHLRGGSAGSPPPPYRGRQTSGSLTPAANHNQDQPPNPPILGHRCDQ